MKFFILVSLLILIKFYYSYKIFVGRTGVGKSYIVTLLGCISKSCDSSDSCTKEAVICEKEKLIDTMGMDDNESHRINYNGNSIMLSGFIYPLYNLFENLERLSIYNAQFFFVYDSNNIREGHSSLALKNFLEKELKCPFKRILNKYREVHKSIKLNEDILISENSNDTNIDKKIIGIPCSFGLNKNWRHKLINQDLEGIRSKLDISKCDSLKIIEKNYKTIMSKNEMPIDNEDCKFKKYIDTVCIRPGLLWGCWEYKYIYETRINENCIVRRDERNKSILEINKFIKEEKARILDKYTELLDQISECKAFANYNFKEDL